MPPAVRKDRFHAFGIQSQSASRPLSKDFEAKLEALVDYLLALPLVQGPCSSLRWCANAVDHKRLHVSSFSRCQLFENELWDEQVKEFGFYRPSLSA
jgi:hypothetical protein